MKLSGMNQGPDDRNYEVKSPACSTQLYTRFSCSPLISSDLSLSAQFDRVGPGSLANEPVQSPNAASTVIKSSIRTHFDKQHNCFVPTTDSLVAPSVPQYVRSTSSNEDNINHVTSQHNSHQHVHHTTTSVPSVSLSSSTSNSTDVHLINGSATPAHGTDYPTPSDLNGCSGSHTPASIGDPDQRHRMDLTKLDETIDYVLAHAVSDEPCEGMFVLSCRQLLDPAQISSPLLRVSTPSSGGQLVSPSPPPSPNHVPHSSPVLNNSSRPVLGAATGIEHVQSSSPTTLVPEHFLTTNTPISLVHFYPPHSRPQISPFASHLSIPSLLPHQSPVTPTSSPSGYNVRAVNVSTNHHTATCCITSSCAPPTHNIFMSSTTKLNLVHTVSNTAVTHLPRVTTSHPSLSITPNCESNRSSSALLMTSPPPTCSSCVLRTSALPLTSPSNESSPASFDRRTLLQQQQQQPHHSVCFRQPTNPAQSCLPPPDISTHTTGTGIRPPPLPPVVPPDCLISASVTSHNISTSPTVRSPVTASGGLYRKRNYASNPSGSSKRRKSSIVPSGGMPSPSPPPSSMSPNLYVGPKHLSADTLNRINPSVIQEYMDRLKLNDIRPLVSAPVLKSYTSVLVPVGVSDTPSTVLRQPLEESMLSRKNIKYSRGVLSLRPPKCGISNLDKVDSYIFRHLCASTPSGPILNDMKEVISSTQSICRSPEPVTFENNMQTLFSSIRQSPKEEANCDVVNIECTFADRNFVTKLLPIFSSVCADASDNPHRERSSPPLQFFHMPNPKLICKPIRLASNDLTNRHASYSTGMYPSTASKTESMSPVRLEKQDVSTVDSNKQTTIFNISPPPKVDIPTITSKIAQSLAVDKDSICCHLTSSGVQVTLDSVKTQNVNYVRSVECRMREIFAPSNVYCEQCTNSLKNSDQHHTADIGICQSSLSKSNHDAKLSEETMSIHSLSSRLQDQDRFCQNCDKRLFLEETAVHKKCLSDMASSVGLSNRLEFTTTNVNDEFVFCSADCLRSFSHSLFSRLNAFDPYPAGVNGAEVNRTQTNNLVCDLPSSCPVFLQNGPQKLARHRRSGLYPGCKRRGSAHGQNSNARRKLWRDIYWYEFTEDLLPNTSKVSRLISNRVSPAECSQPEKSHLLTSSLSDERTCRLCELKGDGPDHGVGRLLPSDTNQWLHVNCALWCFNVYETVSGSLNNVAESVDRAMETSCTHCFRFGAGLPCYNPRCSFVYHVPCALDIGCMFFTDRGMYCPQHQPRDPHPMQLPSLAVDRRVYITRDENNQVGDVVHEEDRTSVVRIGAVCLHNVGQLLPHQLESGHFHNRRFIYPVSFKTSRLYWSMRVPLHRSLYLCEIVESSTGRPLFRVTATDDGMEDEIIEDETCNGVWHSILSRIANVREDKKLVKLFSQHIKGEELYGLCEPHVMRAVESLPGVDCLRDYVFNFGRMELIAEMPLAINPSGCARCEPKMQTYVKRVNLTGSSGSDEPSSGVGVRGVPLPGLRRSAFPGHNGVTNGECSKQYQSSRSQQYRRLKSEVSTNVILGRSRIQGLGLFAARDLEPQTMVIEYIGELIRLELANKREKEYEAHNRGIYMFRLDDATVIDATMTGGLARYINHSCQSNCFAECLNFGDRSHIVIITTRHIDKGEELCYDYNFDLEDGGSKIPCLCRAPNCRKWMN